jgi:hypothetical protein
MAAQEHEAHGKRSRKSWHSRTEYPLFFEGDLKYLIHLIVILGVVVLTLFARFQVKRSERRRNEKPRHLDNVPELQQKQFKT